MAETDRSTSRSVRMTTEEIVQRSFSSKVRGISESEVRTFLRRVADEMNRLGQSEDDLSAQVAQLKEELSAKPQATKSELLEILGEQTTRVLSSAEEAAEQMVNEAREESEATRLAAKNDSEQMIHDARAQSEQSVSDAQSRVRALQESSERDAATVISEARAHGREIFQESVVVREQILKDLLRRRDLLLEQIEELRKGREELLESYKIVKGSFQQATDALHSVEEKASSELMANPIDVDDLLKTPVELPEILDANSTTPISAFDQDETAQVNAEAAREPEKEIVLAEIEAQETQEAQATQESEQSESAEGVPSITGKRSGLKTYVKGALGVGEEGSVAVIPDTQSTDVAPTLPSVKTVDETTTKSQAKKEAPKKDVGELFKSLKDQKSDKTPSEKPEATATEEVQKPEATESKKSAKKPSKKKSAKNPVAQRDDVISDVISSVLRKAKRQLQDEQNELLEALRTVKPKKRVAAENILSDEQTQLKVWEEAIRTELDSVFAAGAATVSQEKVSYDADASKSAVSWIVSPLRETLVIAIDEGEQDDATTRVGARYREWRNNELKTALNDALCSAYNNGVLTAAKNDATMKWNVEKAGQCPDCDDNALEPTSAHEAFPTGHVAPPAHSGCRCVLTVA